MFARVLCAPHVGCELMEIMLTFGSCCLFVFSQSAIYDQNEINPKRNKKRTILNVSRINLTVEEEIGFYIRLHGGMTHPVMTALQKVSIKMIKKSK